MLVIEMITSDLETQCWKQSSLLKEPREHLFLKPPVPARLINSPLYVFSLILWAGCCCKDTSIKI